MKRRTGQNKVILLSGRFLVRSEVLASLDVRWSHQAVDALALHQPMQQLSYSAAGRVDRHDAAAKAMRHPRYIDAPATGVSLRRGTAKLSGRLDPRDINEDVNRWIDRESNDVRHWVCPFRRMIRVAAFEINLAKRK